MLNDIISNLASEKRPLVLGSILKTTGSSPQVQGAAAIFSATGIVSGTLGGGVLEFEASKRAERLAAEGGALLFTYELNSDITSEGGAICGGKVLLLLDGDCLKYNALFREIGSSLLHQIPGVLVTQISSIRGESARVSRSWITRDTVDNQEKNLPGGLSRDWLLKSLENRVPELLDDEDNLIFLEPIYPLPELLIVGAGHIGQALSHIGSLLDFNVTVVDSRPEFATRERFPDAGRVIADDIDHYMGSREFGPDCYVVIMTTGHTDDTRALRRCISSGAAYIGMIGSKRKVAQVRQRFLDEGWATAKLFDRVHAPIGLPIPSKTIQEIAISIAAELIVARKEAHEEKNSRQVWSVILAAGESKRMKEQKLLMPYRESTMIEQVVIENLASRTDGVLVVIGSGRERMMEKLAGYPVKTVYNELFRDGMLSSVKKGIGSLAGNCDAAIVCLGDQPMISREVIDRLLDVFSAGQGNIIIPVFRGKRGHPLLLPADLFEEILGISPGESLRSILVSHPERIMEVEVDREDILRDIDTREEYDSEINK